MSHADELIPWGPVPGPVTGKRPQARRWWLLLAWLAVAGLAVTAATVQARHFLWGGVPLTDVSPGFGTSGAPGTSGGFGSPFDTPVVSPDGRTRYVPSDTNSITPVATATRKAAPRIRISGPGSVAAIAVTPDSRTLFAAMADYDTATAPGRPLARVDLRTGRETGRVDVAGGADDFLLSREGKTLYVVSTFRFIVDRNNNGTGEVHSALYAVNATTGCIERRVPIPPGLLDGEVAMVLSPDGAILYLALEPDSGQNKITSVSLRTGQPGSTFDFTTSRDRWPSPQTAARSTSPQPAVCKTASRKSDPTRSPPSTPPRAGHERPSPGRRGLCTSPWHQTGKPSGSCRPPAKKRPPRTTP